jgi:acyl carrier protein phosphodiesterase
MQKVLRSCTARFSYLSHMNFLAHLYLSGDDPRVRVGNFIGDFVKGRDLPARFGAPIAAGIQLHREIDHFTDRHPVVKKSKARLWPVHRHYAGVVVDLYYDHFLARRWPEFHHSLLPDYAAACYQVVLSHLPVLPEKMKRMLPLMMKDDWLSNYAKLEGLGRAFSGLAQRTRFASNMDQAIPGLQRHYADFENEFLAFFPDLQHFARTWMDERGK